MWKLEDRGPMMIEPGWKVYRGMIVGEHTRDNDLEINVLKGKQLTNIRTTRKDEAVRLTPPIRMTLEKALAYIEDDELVEVTPKSIRLRKKLLDPNDRKRAERAQGSRDGLTLGAGGDRRMLSTSRAVPVRHDRLPANHFVPSLWINRFSRALTSPNTRIVRSRTAISCGRVSPSHILQTRRTAHLLASRRVRTP